MYTHTPSTCNQILPERRGAPRRSRFEARLSGSVWVGAPPHPPGHGMAKLRGRAGGAPKPKRKAPKARSGKELQAAKRRPPGGKPGAEAEEEGGASLRFDWILELDREGEALKYGHMVVVERFTVLRGGEEVIGIAAAFQANEAEGAEGNHRQHIRFSVSYDNGKTWTPSICVMYGLQASWSPVLHWDAWTDEEGEKRGVLFLFYSESRKERSPGGDIKCIKAESWEQACGGVDGWKVEDSYWSPPVTILTHEAEICRPSDESARHPIGFPKVLANRVMRTREFVPESSFAHTFDLYKDLSGFPLRCTPTAEWVLPFWQEPHNSYLHYEAYHPLKELPPKEGLTPPHRTLAKGSALGPAASVLASSDYGRSWEVRGAVRHPDTWLIENPVVEVWKSELEMNSSGKSGSLRALKLWLMFFRTGAGEIWFSQSPPLTPATGGVSGYTWHGCTWCHPPEGSGAYGREWSEPRPVRWARSYPWHPGLAKGWKVVEKAQAALAGTAAAGLSGADLVCLLGAHAVAVTGGPAIEVPVGRPDAAGADPEGRLPAETLSASELKATFAAMGFGTVR